MNNFLFLFLFFSNACFGYVYVTIGTPEFKKPVLAFSYTQCAKDCALINDAVNIAKEDLLNSNVFTNLPQALYPENNNWKLSGTEYLIIINGTATNMSFSIEQISTNAQVFSQLIKFKKLSAIDLGHEIADRVFLNLTEEHSIFKTKITFVCKTGLSKNLFTIDYDGKRLKQETFYKTIILSPAWAPDFQNIAYTRYGKKLLQGSKNTYITNQNLYLYNLKTKKELLISDAVGQNSGAAWSRDGKYLLFTLSKGKDPDIYIYDTFTRNTQLLISNVGLDVEPSFSPNSENIVFSSSKTGNPELFIYNIASQKQTRLTFNRYYNSSPSWSPDNKYIAFAGLDNPFNRRSFFDIFLINPAATKLERLTISNGNNEDPSWAPNGMHLVYSSTRNGGSDIYFINTDGTGDKRLTNGLDCYSPDWSFN